MKIRILALIFLVSNVMAQSDFPIAQTTIYNSNGIEKPLSHQQFQYNLNGQQVGVSQYNWNSAQQKWTLTWMQEKEFDQGNEVISKAWFWKRFPDSLQYYYANNKKFNDQQQPIYSSWFTEETNDKGIVSSYENRDTYFYDTNGCKIKVETERLDNNKISGKSEATYKVNASCQILESFVDQQLNRYEYDNGLLIRETGYTIRIDTTLYFENIFRYNQNRQLILTESNGRLRNHIDYAPNGKANHYWMEYLPDSSSTWMPISESLLTFRDDLLENREYYQGWNLAGEFWEYESRSINYFDNSGRIDSSDYTQHQITLGGSTVVHKEVSQYLRRCDGLEIEKIVNRTIGYDAPAKFTINTAYARPANCEQVRVNPLVIFPNPTQGWTTIVLSELTQNVVVSIFSDNGQLEKSYTFSNGINPIRLDLSELSAGVHTVQVSYGKSAVSSHIIIE